MESLFGNIEFEYLMKTYLVPWAIKLATAIVIFIIGRIVAKFIVNLVTKAMERSGQDQMLINFVRSVLGWALLIVVIVVAIGQLGVETASIIALLGAAGLAVGLALQGSLSNFSSGVMIVVFRPFKEGDWVEVSGVSGSVDNINLFNTELRTGDNKKVIVPNGEIYDNVITNYSAHDTRRIDMTFGIGYDDDMQKAAALIRQVLTQDEAVLDDPEPKIAVGELADSSVNFVVRPWVKTEDYWAAKWRITETIKAAFDQADISIPYPQMDVHMDRPASDGSNNNSPNGDQPKAA